jgi:hypothetical protein
MSLRARGQQKRHAEMRGIGQAGGQFHSHAESLCAIGQVSVRRARVGFCPERIISPQSAALREFPKQCGNGGYVVPSHIIGSAKLHRGASKHNRRRYS